MVLTEITNYIEDDWDDNALTSRTNSTEGYFLHPSDRLLSEGDVEAGTALKGVYRPEWTIEQGSITAANQQLEIPATGGSVNVIATTSEFNTGTFTLDFQYPSGITEGGTNISILSDTNQGFSGNQYIIHIIDNGDYNFARRDSGAFNVVISSIWDDDNNQHESSVEVDSYRNYELFYDASSKGTTTDTTHPTDIFRYFVIGMSMDNEPAEFDNLVIQ